MTVRTPRPIRWLHISDLHLGPRGRGRWWQVQEDFQRSIAAEVDQRGVPDLLLLTGDLSDTGAAAEFDFLDELLAALANWIGASPLVIPVPGNHDLVRPQGFEQLRYRMLDKLAGTTHDVDTALIARELWEKRDASFLAPLFAGYTQWLERSVLPGLIARSVVTRSYFPGDLTVEIDVDGFRLAVVALNSAWMQYQEGQYLGRIVVAKEQLHAALPPAASGGSPLDVFRRCHQALLLLHHPPSWLTDDSGRDFESDIDASNRFALCLHGHLHDQRSDTFAACGGAPRFRFQGASFFGREEYLSGTRPYGYSWGEITSDGTVRVWPRARVRRGSGEHVFIHDPTFPGDAVEGLQLRPWRGPDPPPVVDWRGYLRVVVDDTSYIEITGVAAREARNAGRHPIQRLYTPLRSRGGFGDDSERMRTAGSVELEHGAWQEPGNWAQQRATPNRPVVEVSWHEASAYCRWLSEQRGEKIRLPREQEWSAVATPDGRKYPWGKKEPDDETANFAGNVGRPSPVGAYPRGGGKYGHCDLGGNVWEWCEDKSEKRDPWSEEDVRRLGWPRVPRGGSWYSNAVYLHAAVRSGDPASVRDVSIGFRLAVAAVSL